MEKGSLVDLFDDATEVLAYLFVAFLLTIISQQRCQPPPTTPTPATDGGAIANPKQD